MSKDEHAPRPPKKQIDPVVDFIAGTVAGIAGILVAQPFDTIKVRFQNPTTAARYRSTFHAFGTIIREERFTGLFKGVVSPMLSAAPLNGLIFSSYRSLTNMQLKHEGDEPTVLQYGIAGVGSGIVSSFITCPIELIKIRQQNIIEHRPSTIQVARDIVRRNGFLGLYRGITSTICRDTGYGAYFATYEAACRYFSRRNPGTDDPNGDSTGTRGELTVPALLAAGALAGISGWLGTFAFDVIKTRVQSVDRGAPPAVPGSGAPALAREHPYRSTFSTAVYSYRTEGIQFFFRGMSPTLIRAVPVNMATFGVFELVVRSLS